jgi:hypothetical protein
VNGLEIDWHCLSGWCENVCRYSRFFFAKKQPASRINLKAGRHASAPRRAPRRNQSLHSFAHFCHAVCEGRKDFVSAHACLPAMQALAIALAFSVVFGK